MEPTWQSDDGRYRDKNWLADKYTHLSAVEIARECGVHQNTIYGWIDKHKIPRKGQRKAVIGEVKNVCGRDKVCCQDKSGNIYWKFIRKPPTLEQVLKMCPAAKRKYRNMGWPVPKGSRKGFKCSLVTRIKASVSGRKYLFDMRAMDSEQKNRIRKSLFYKVWRETVFSRDSYTCQKCGARSGNGKTVVLEAHHIRSYSKYPNLRFDPNNGRTLCRKCHLKVSARQMQNNKNGRRKESHGTSQLTELF